MLRRHVIMFQPRFAALVESGAKPHTIRPVRKRTINVGDQLDLRAWTGKPYRSKQRKLREAACVAITSIEVDALHGLVWLGEGFAQKLLTRQAADRLARADGFRDRSEMIDWFEATHGLPFKGELIEWSLTAEQFASIGALASEAFDKRQT